MMQSKRFVLVGHPVGHSISPALHRAAYSALRMPHRYELLDCPDEATLVAVVRALSAGAIAGVNVTLPWKTRVLELATGADARARATGAANVLTRTPIGDVVAHNTDVTALEKELRRLAPGAARALVIGAGGAALAAVNALAALGVLEIAVSARRFVPTVQTAGWPNAARLSAASATLLAWPEAAPAVDEFEAVAARADLVIQVTSAGMRGGAPGESVSRIVPWSRLRRSTVAYDVVYTPRVTPFIASARSQGLSASDGLGMLVLQATDAIELWLGARVADSVLHQAAERALGEGVDSTSGDEG